MGLSFDDCEKLKIFKEVMGLKVKIVNAINVKEVEVNGIKFGKDGSRYYYREGGKKQDIWSDMDSYEGIVRLLKKGKEEIRKLWKWCIKAMRERKISKIRATKPFMKGEITVRYDDDGWTASVATDYSVCTIDLNKFEEDYYKKLKAYEELARIGKLFKIAKKHLGYHSIE